MKYKNIKHSWFTLIEILVSITILSIILISVFSVYISSTQISLKTDITRALQQNVKSSIEKISEDIRKNGFDCVINSISLDACILPWIDITNKWNVLSVDWNYYSVANFNHISWKYEITDISNCDEIEEKCTLVIHNWVWSPKPIMNSWVDVKNIEFLVSATWPKKVTIIMTLQPAIGKGIQPNLIKESRFHFQTTISQRINLN